MTPGTFGAARLPSLQDGWTAQPHVQEPERPPDTEWRTAAGLLARVVIGSDDGDPYEKGKIVCEVEDPQPGQRPMRFLHDGIVQRDFRQYTALDAFHPSIASARHACESLAVQLVRHIRPEKSNSTF